MRAFHFLSVSRPLSDFCLTSVLYVTHAIHVQYRGCNDNSNDPSIASQSYKSIWAAISVLKVLASTLDLIFQDEKADGRGSVRAGRHGGKLWLQPCWWRWLWGNGVGSNLWPLYSQTMLYAGHPIPCQVSGRSGKHNLDDSVFNKTGYFPHIRRHFYDKAVRTVDIPF